MKQPGNIPFLSLVQESFVLWQMDLRTEDKIEFYPNIIKKNPVITRDERIGYARLPKIILQSQPESPACRVMANDKAR